MRARLLQLAAAATVAASLALGGCGDDDATDLASLVPPDVPLYVEAVLRPDHDQQAAIESLTSKAAGLDDPGQALVAALDESLATEPGDFTYADDIEPWLGDRGALFVRSFGDTPDAAVLVEVSDTGAAEDFLDQAAEADPQATSQTYE